MNPLQLAPCFVCPCLATQPSSSGLATVWEKSETLALGLFIEHHCKYECNFIPLGIVCKMNMHWAIWSKVSQWTVQEIGTRCHFLSIFSYTVLASLLFFLSGIQSYESPSTHVLQMAAISGSCTSWCCSLACRAQCPDPCLSVHSSNISKANKFVKHTRRWLFDQSDITSRSLADECCPGLWWPTDDMLELLVVLVPWASNKEVS